MTKENLIFYDMPNTHKKKNEEEIVGAFSVFKSTTKHRKIKYFC